MPKKILVIDDEPSARQMLCDYLEIQGYIALQAEDGLKGISLASSENPDLILLDVSMPKMNGLEVLRVLRAKVPLASVLMLSGVYDEDIAKKSVQLGAFDYWTKPVDLVQLQDMIHRILGE